MEEELPSNTPVYTIIATDETDVVTYDIISNPNNHFQVDPNTGLCRIIQSGWRHMCGCSEYSASCDTSLQENSEHTDVRARCHTVSTDVKTRCHSSSPLSATGYRPSINLLSKVRSWVCPQETRSLSISFSEGCLVAKSHGKVSWARVKAGTVTCSNIRCAACGSYCRCDHSGDPCRLWTGGPCECCSGCHWQWSAQSVDFHGNHQYWCGECQWWKSNIHNWGMWITWLMGKDVKSILSDSTLTYLTL